MSLPQKRKTCLDRRLKEQNESRQLKCGRTRNSGHGKASSKLTGRAGFAMADVTCPAARQLPWFILLFGSTTKARFPFCGKAIGGPTPLRPPRAHGDCERTEGTRPRPVNAQVRAPLRSAGLVLKAQSPHGQRRPPQAGKRGAGLRDGHG